MTDLRDDILAAAQEVEGQEEETKEVETPSNPEPTQESDLNQQPDDVADINSEVSTEQKGETKDEIPPPHGWTSDMKQHFQSLPPDVRKYIAEREKQQHAYISRVGGEHGKLRKEFGELDSILKPYENDIKQSGLTKGQVLERLISERAEMSKDPATFIKKFADLHKIDLLHISVDSDMADPPEVRKARWEYQEKERQVEAERQKLTAQQEEIAKHQLGTYIEGWGQSKPHFQEVRKAMAQVLPEIQAQYPYMSFQEQLDVTYSEVLKHPSFANLGRKTVPESVKKAGSGVSGYTGTPTPTTEPASIREALLQAAKETNFNFK